MEFDLGRFNPVPISQSQCKRRRISIDGADTSLLPHISHEVKNVLPTLRFSDYYTKPCLNELAVQELKNPGYCSRVQDFTVGRIGYGHVKFLSETDVRCLNLNHIIKFNRCEIVVYEDEGTKPLIGQGLNKTAEVTLQLKLKPLSNYTKGRLTKVVKKLKCKTESQGAQFLSFDPVTNEWRFLVHHFSRFGLSEDDEEDIAMDYAPTDGQDFTELNGSEISDVDEESDFVDPIMLSHSLPAHLGLDPSRMKEMRMLLFPSEEEELENFKGSPPFVKESLRKMSSPTIRKTPLALIEYNPGNFNSTQPGSILMAQQNKGFPIKTSVSEGFKLDLKQQKTPVTESHSRNVVDAALFMGRSFRVGWGPNGVLIHSGNPVGSSDSQSVLSSVIYLEKVAIDKVVRDQSGKVKEELVDLCFNKPLTLHKELNHEIKRVQSSDLKLQRAICDRFSLPEICRSYIDVIERQLEVPTLTSASRVFFMHQVMVWELIKILFSSKKLKTLETEDEEDMLTDGKENSPEVDIESLPLIRRAEFSYWLQESVYHKVQEEVSSLSESSELEHIFLLLTGRQLDASVELAASRGDVRLSILLSQAGGSPANRSDVGHQLDIWRKNGMDFDFFEDDRVRLLELLAGNIHAALHGNKIDWKRFLGLLMWYQLAPDTSLPVVFDTYQKLLNNGGAPCPVPVYIDEGLVEASGNWGINDRFDLAYYLMLLHARGEKEFGALKTMFSAFASTNDPLDYHMIWHQRAILESIGTFSSNDLHVLDMGFVSQLLCVGLCQWAIYVVLHMPHREDYPHLQSRVIREILFQYCEVWSKEDEQWKFIESLGVPSAWLHEALAIYFSYNVDLSKALHHFLECGNWQRAHSIFLVSVAHSLFLSANDSEIWRLATSMEDHKSEIEDWDLGAGIYISFYELRNSLKEDANTMTELDTLENKNDVCSDFFNRLNKSLAVWGSKLPVDARVVYSKMAEEISTLLLSDSGEDSTGEVQLRCFDTVFVGPVPEDLRSQHLQGAISLFTCCLSEMTQ